MARFLDQEAVYVRGNVMTERGSDCGSSLESDNGSNSEGEDVTLESSDLVSKNARRSKRKLSLFEESGSDEDTRNKSHVDIKDKSKKRKATFSLASHVIRKGNGEKTRGSNDQVLKEVQKSNKLLLTLVHRVEKTERRLKVVEDKLTNESTSSSGADSTPSRKCSSKKKDVPDEVRVCVLATS